MTNWDAIPVTCIWAAFLPFPLEIDYADTANCVYHIDSIHSAKDSRSCSYDLAEDLVVLIRIFAIILAQTRLK